MKTYITPDNFTDLTGFNGLDNYQRPSINPLLQNRTVKTADQRKESAKSRAGTLNERFSNKNVVTQDQYSGAYPGLAQAQAQLQNTLGTLSLMTDKYGYIAYKTVDKLGHDTYSSNLTRLRSALMKGMDAVVRSDDGVRIPNIPDGPSRDGMAIATSKCWTVCIAWHRLLNSSRSYVKNDIASKNMSDVYDKMIKRKADNLQHRIEYWANNPEEFAKIRARADASKVSANARSDARIARLNRIANLIGASGGQADIGANNNGSSIDEENNLAPPLNSSVFSGIKR